MATARYMTADFTAFAGSIVGVGYALLNPDGTVNVARTTVGVVAPVAGVKFFGANVTLPTGFAGTVAWDTGGGSPAYAFATINPSVSADLVTILGDAPSVANLKGDELLPAVPVATLGTGTVVGTPTTTSIAISGANLIATSGIYTKRRLYYNTYLTDPCLAHTVTGTGPSAVHTFTFATPALVAPASGDTVSLGPY